MPSVLLLPYLLLLGVGPSRSANPSLDQNALSEGFGRTIKRNVIFLNLSDFEIYVVGVFFDPPEFDN